MLKYDRQIQMSSVIVQVTSTIIMLERHLRKTHCQYESIHLCTQDEVVELCNDLETKAKLNFKIHIGQVICKRKQTLCNVPASIFYNDIEINHVGDVAGLKTTLLGSVLHYRCTVQQLSAKFNGQLSTPNQPFEVTPRPQPTENVYSTIQEQSPSVIVAPTAEVDPTTVEETYTPMTDLTVVEDPSLWDNDDLYPSRYGIAYQQLL